MPFRQVEYLQLNDRFDRPQVRGIESASSVSDRVARNAAASPASASEENAEVLVSLLRPNGQG